MEDMIKTQDIERIVGVSHEVSTEKLSFLGPFTGGDKIRLEFSQLNASVLLPFLSDIGDIGSKGSDQLCDVVKEFSEEQGCTISFRSTTSNDTISDEFWDSFANPVIVSSRPRISESRLTQIGLQKHFFSTAFDFDPNIHVRLGDIRENLEKAEVSLRTADCIVINLDVLRLSDVLGSKTATTAGLMIEELCMIAKYAGASTFLKSIIIEGYDENQDIHGFFAKNIALILYYVLDGYAIRSQEKKQSEQLQRYSVLPDHTSQELVFIEDQRSSRWWVELFSDGAEEVVKMPCSRQDYDDACNNIISDRITALLSVA